jgi:archaellum component FlaC
VEKTKQVVETLSEDCKRYREHLEKISLTVHPFSEANPQTSQEAKVRIQNEVEQIKTIIAPYHLKDPKNVSKLLTIPSTRCFL